MSTVTAANAQLTAQQVLARLLAMPANSFADVAAFIHPSALNQPVGISVLAAQTVQELRRAQGWRVPPGVALSTYHLSR